MKTYDLENPVTFAGVGTHLPNNAESIFLVSNGYGSLVQFTETSEDGINLSEIPNLITRFLRASGYDYVTGVTISTGINEFASDC